MPYARYRPAPDAMIVEPLSDTLMTAGTTIVQVSARNAIRKTCRLQLVSRRTRRRIHGCLRWRASLIKYQMRFLKRSWESDRGDVVVLSHLPLFHVGRLGELCGRRGARMTAASRHGIEEVAMVTVSMVRRPTCPRDPYVRRSRYNPLGSWNCKPNWHTDHLTRDPTCESWPCCWFDEIISSWRASPFIDHRSSNSIGNNVKQSVYKIVSDLKTLYRSR
jgi:hypothetical protein